MNYLPANERTENENSLLDKDGFPPCTMTLDEFIAHLRDAFAHSDFHVIAFAVRVYAGCTLTTRRGQMKTIRATPREVEACKRARASKGATAG